MRHHLNAIFACVLAASAISCAPVGDDAELGEPFELYDGFEDDFDPNHLISDRAFFDEDAMSVADVQAFFEESPYGRRNFLADERMADGRSFAAALVSAAKTNGLNPLVLLASLQKETSLISIEARPSRNRIDFAMGCGCPDGQACSEQFRGLDKQLSCITKSLVNHQTSLLAIGNTLTGWQPGTSKTTLDPQRVNPANRATAILYTYTPWVLERRGGNWAFWAIYTKYARHSDYAQGLELPYNEGFIGGSCESDDDCFFEGGTCKRSGSGPGTCTMSCTRLCPDRPGMHYATTFCIGAGQGPIGECVTQCPAGSCGDGQRCVERSRNGDPASKADVCVAD